MKIYDVFGIGNGLVDCVIQVTDKFLNENNIEKGLMTLVDDDKQKSIIDKIKNSNPFVQSGGSVTNSIYTLSHLGGSGYLSFLVSDDEHGKLFLDDLNEGGVSTADKKFFLGKGMTGSCLVLTTPDAERTMNTCLAISSKYSIKNINYDDLKLSKYLYIEGYLVTSEIALDAIKKTIIFCKENNIKISLTFSDLSMVKYFKEKFDEILVEKIDLLFCNKDEALTYTGQNNFKDCCTSLLKLSEMIVITDGKEGSYIVSEFNTIKIDPYPVQAIDSVGAGDTFAGAFLYGINNGLTNEKAGKLASALSSKVVTKLGPRLNKDIIESIKLTIE